jgi:hypothetical protein
MKKTLFIVGVMVAILGVAAGSYAHGPSSGYGPGSGFRHMGPGMHGARHMGQTAGPGSGPCWQTAESSEQPTTPSEDQAKAATEQYLQHFLPGTKLEKKAEKPATE